MKLYTPALFLILLATACGQPSKTDNAKSPQLAPSAPVAVKVPSPQSASKWFDSLSVVYNKTTKNELVRIAVADKTLNEEWLFDQELKTDTASYYRYQVGHDLTDADGSRFITDAWIYVDTVKRRFYEQLPDQQLMEWKP
ncbi:hypothetical protein [Mucilaginibacter psychrotolerans]|uniref:Lipoprotein n=1 Tax=Mucilaginibacter psychrotolerans TaxID=1524096 RepID=A0A4Y8SMI3_9SPHI|nr:hypothetical protein [Mucilaginibacter psychrotolerans]TFF39747.1 hypothetical protein E2R66_05110 [Mucilaginibacter psychrotolerans]